MTSLKLGPYGKPNAPVRHAACALLVLCCTAVAACGKNEKPPPRGLVDSEGNPLELRSKPVPRSAQAAEQEDAEPDFGSDDSPFEDTPLPTEAAPSAPEVTGAPPAAARLPGSNPPAGLGTAPEAPTRDLAQELIALLPSPATCIDFARAVRNGGKLVVGVEAMVMPSGRISRASVSAPGQSAEALRCLEQGVLDGSLPGNVPNAPLTVRASLPLEIVGQAPAPSPAQEAPQAPSGDVARPDGTEFARPSD